MLAAPRGQDQVDRIRPAHERGERGLDGVPVVVDVFDRHNLRAQAFDLRPDAGLEPFPRRAAHRLLDDDPDATRHERRDPHDRMAPETGEPRSRIDRRGIDEMRRHLDAGDQLARLDDLAIEDREDLERIDTVQPLQLRDTDVEDAGCLRVQVDPALGRAPDRQPRAGDGGRETDGRIVFVQLPGLRYQDADGLTGLGGGKRGQVVRGEPAALRPALARDGQVPSGGRPRPGARVRAAPG